MSPRHGVVKSFSNKRMIGCITTLEATVTQQQKQIEALTGVVQKVSDQLELDKPAPQIVANNQ